MGRNDSAVSSWPALAKDQNLVSSAHILVRFGVQLILYISFMDSSPHFWHLWAPALTDAHTHTETHIKTEIRMNLFLKCGTKVTISFLKGKTFLFKHYFPGTLIHPLVKLQFQTYYFINVPPESPF